MTYRSTTPPLCRYCGGPIRKWTQVHLFGRSQRECDQLNPHGWSVHHVEKPATKAEVARLVNGQVVFVRRSTDGSSIDQVNTWDGESWDDEFFCKMDHGTRFGYAAARAGQAMPAYNQALRTSGGAGHG